MRNEHSKTRIESFLKLKQLQDELLSLLRDIKILHNVDRRRISESQSRISSAVNLITGDIETNKAISDRDISRISNRIHDMSRRGRSHLLLYRKEDGSGLVDLIDGTEYLFVDRIKS